MRTTAPGHCLPRVFFLYLELNLIREGVTGCDGHPAPGGTIRNPCGNTRHLIKLVKIM
jgi:hypothetical protein